MARYSFATYVMPWLYPYAGPASIPWFYPFSTSVVPVLVQQANTTRAFGAGNTVVTPGSATGAGSTLILAVSWFGSATVTVSDTAGNTWTIAANTTVTTQNPPAGFDATSTNGGFVAWVLAAASVTSVTLTSAADYGMDVTLSEWTGLPALAGASAAAGAAVGGGAASVLPSITLLTASDVVVSAVSGQFNVLTPVAPLAAFSSDTSGETAFGQPGAAGGFVTQWGNANNRRWGAGAAAFTT